VLLQNQEVFLLPSGKRSPQAIVEVHMEKDCFHKTKKCFFFPPESAPLKILLKCTWRESASTKPRSVSSVMFRASVKLQTYAGSVAVYETQRSVPVAVVPIGVLFGWQIRRVGQNRIYTPHMTVYSVISLPKIPYVHRIYMVPANHTNTRA
jgi:hypothetical protein